MTPDEAKRLLASSAGAEDPVFLPPEVLGGISLDDVPKDTPIEIGRRKGIVHELEWNGRFVKKADTFVGEADYTWTRKYWYSPLGLEQYLDLVRRAAEVRRQTCGDVLLLQYDDDGAFIHMGIAVTTQASNLNEALSHVKSVCAQIEETADKAADDVGRKIAQTAARLSAWGTKSMDALIDTVENSISADEKGRSLEELMSRLLETVSGFSVTGRTRTATEEIDITVLNDSNDPRFRRESALLLA